MKHNEIENALPPWATCWAIDGNREIVAYGDAPACDGDQWGYHAKIGTYHRMGYLDPSEPLEWRESLRFRSPAPVWLNCPDWVMWQATDADGSAWGHESEPEPRQEGKETTWYINRADNHNAVKLATVATPANWRETLIARPVAENVEDRVPIGHQLKVWQKALADKTNALTAEREKVAESGRQLERMTEYEVAARSECKNLSKKLDEVLTERAALRGAIIELRAQLASMAHVNSRVDTLGREAEGLRIENAAIRKNNQTEKELVAHWQGEYEDMRELYTTTAQERDEAREALRLAESDRDDWKSIRGVLTDDNKRLEGYRSQLQSSLNDANNRLRLALGRAEHAEHQTMLTLATCQALEAAAVQSRESAKRHREEIVSLKQKLNDATTIPAPDYDARDPLPVHFEQHIGCGRKEGE